MLQIYLSHIYHLSLQDTVHYKGWCRNSLKLIGLCLLQGNEQLQKKVLEAGEGRDSRPQKGKNVKIHLKTYLMDGTLVEEQSDLSFTLGDGDVIQVKALL